MRQRKPGSGAVFGGMGPVDGTRPKVGEPNRFAGGTWTLYSLRAEGDKNPGEVPAGESSLARIFGLNHEGELNLRRGWSRESRLGARAEEEIPDGRWAQRALTSYRERGNPIRPLPHGLAKL